MRNVIKLWLLLAVMLRFQGSPIEPKRAPVHHDWLEDSRLAREMHRGF